MREGVTILLEVVFLGAFGYSLRDGLCYFSNPLFFEVVIKLGRVFLLLFFLLLLLHLLLLLFLLFLMLLLWLAVVFNQEVVMPLPLDLKIDILILKKVVEVLNVFGHKSLDDFELAFFLNSHADGLLCTVIRTFVIDVHLVEIFLE